ncbi:hypothetical protein CTEN210_04891 [Chaetoceros tenuissimus]|uniref:Uncharacterized protein n=1 Tax=Chaetoceros tenuissimus TaxID=426638 RepID=A0AAD3CNP1_9STRA|nr:hypothetical protein CTEN210_04891 [Chaetoceros tenuissimus]
MKQVQSREELQEEESVSLLIPSTSQKQLPDQKRSQAKPLYEQGNKTKGNSLSYTAIMDDDEDVISEHSRRSLRSRDSRHRDEGGITLKKGHIPYFIIFILAISTAVQTHRLNQASSNVHQDGTFNPNYSESSANLRGTASTNVTEANDEKSDVSGFGRNSPSDSIITESISGFGNSPGSGEVDANSFGIAGSANTQANVGGNSAFGGTSGFTSASSGTGDSSAFGGTSGFTSASAMTGGFGTAALGAQMGSTPQQPQFGTQGSSIGSAYGQSAYGQMQPASQTNSLMGATETYPSTASSTFGSTQSGYGQTSSSSFVGASSTDPSLGTSTQTGYGTSQPNMLSQQGFNPTGTTPGVSSTGTASSSAFGSVTGAQIGSSLEASAQGYTSTGASTPYGAQNSLMTGSQSVAVQPINPAFLQPGKLPSKDLLELSNFKDTWDEREAMDLPVFFRTGAERDFEHLLHSCHRLITASEQGVTNGHESDQSIGIFDIVTDKAKQRFVNIDTSTQEGISRAIQLGYATSGSLGQIVITPYIYETNSLLAPNPTLLGRYFALFAHPVERTVHIYNKLKLTDPEVSIMTFEQYAASTKLENNYLTRKLANLQVGELGEEHMEIAMEVIRRKFLVGLTRNRADSLVRFEQFFQWTFRMNPEEQQSCISRILENIDTGVVLPVQGSTEYQLIEFQNQFDLQLYSYIESLFIQQEQFVSLIPKDIRSQGATCCECSPATIPPEGFQCPTIATQ